MQHVEHVADALELLRVCRFQALLLDLASLGGSRLDALDRIRLVGLRVPVVLLSDRDDPVEAQSALRGGAQDYLDLASEGPRRLPRALLYAVERHQLIADLLVSRHRAQLAATHDPLTQLPNRYLLLQQMERVLPQAARSGASAALLHVDLDRFKALNDALGHRAGDEVLAQVAARLARCTRRGDVVARVGGDEFLLLLTDIGGDSAPSTVAGKIHKELEAPFQLAGREYWISASIGIAVFPRDGDDPTALMSQADLALGQAKTCGRSQVQFYSESLNESSRRRHVLEQGLRRALERGGLRLAYQPIFEAKSLRIVAAEALLRWDDPELGLVPPLEFVRVAEETGLIVPLGEAVLRTACEQLAQWKREGQRLRMMVNISAHQIDEVRLRQLVVQALWDADLRPEDLALEVTESALMRDERAAVQTISELKRIGVGISLDDFGTGFSSLNYLKRFPVDTVKIDRSFVRDLTFDPDDAAIVAAILSIARQLDLTVVAEGVETEEQRVFLSERLCSHLQGFLLCPPLPPDELGQLLRRGAAAEPLEKAAEG